MPSDPLQFLAIAVIIGVVLLLIYLGVRPKPADKKTWVEQLRKDLNRVAQMTQSTDQLTANSAIIEADKLLHHALKSANYAGETTGQMLKSASTRFDRNLYNRVWNAHKERNKLVHELNYKIDGKDVKYHFYNLKKAILRIIELA